jgi:hypothetical protein
LFNDGDSVMVIMNSSYQCLTKPSDSSATRVTKVIPNVTPSISISVNPAGAVCPGDVLNFTSVAAGQGTNPVYQWQVNSVPAGGNNPFFTSTMLSCSDYIV